MEKLWYHRLESFPAAKPPNNVKTTQTPITVQRFRAAKCPRAASRPESEPFNLVHFAGAASIDFASSPRSTGLRLGTHRSPYFFAAESFASELFVAVPYAHRHAQVGSEPPPNGALSQRRVHAVHARLHRFAPLPRRARTARTGAERVRGASCRRRGRGPVSASARRAPPHLAESYGVDHRRARAAQTRRAQAAVQRPSRPDPPPHVHRPEAPHTGNRGRDAVRTADHKAAHSEGAHGTASDARPDRRRARAQARSPRGATGKDVARRAVSRPPRS